VAELPTNTLKPSSPLPRFFGIAQRQCPARHDSFPVTAQPTLPQAKIVHPVLQQRIRRLAILVAGGLWLAQTHHSAGDEGRVVSSPSTTESDINPTDRARQVLSLDLDAINCVRANEGLNEVRVDKALTHEAMQRLQALRPPAGARAGSPRKGDEIRPAYCIVFPLTIKTGACSLPRFSERRARLWPRSPMRTANGQVLEIFNRSPPGG